MLTQLTSLDRQGRTVRLAEHTIIFTQGPFMKEVIERIRH